MFDRKEGKKDTLLTLEDRAERLDKFYSLIRSSGEKIHFLLKVVKRRFSNGGVKCRNRFLSFTRISSCCEVIVASGIQG